MDFVLINEIFNQRGLKKPTLEVLDLDGNLYTSLLFQPVDKIEYSDDYIRIADTELAKQKLSSFFELAIESNVELAITPEYSCPWSVIECLIEEDKLPRESKLWVIGCESIHSQELSDIINNHDEIIWVYDEERVQEYLANNHLFFDPVCYLLKTRTHEGNELKTIAIVQFKTQFMGGIVWERDNCIKGRQIYVLENQNLSSKLFTLICSDALHNDFNIQAGMPQGPPDFAIDPYLIIHIQLNHAPFNIDFRRYRGDIYNRDPGNKEVICLNWGRGVKMNDDPNSSNYGGSAIFTKSEKLDLGDERINNNHN